MSTDIVPSSGAGALFTQQGVGTTPGYAALDDRRSNGGSLQEGVLGTSTLVTAGGVSNVVAADFLVSQRAAGANLSVDINMPAGGFAWVQGDTINGQGLYTVPVHSANINEVIATADATNPRVDQVILEVLDNVLDASGSNKARTRVVTGTPQPGATLANRTGAAALPGSALLLADVLVGATVTTLANAVIRDRRKWARGAHVIFTQTSGSFTTVSTSYVDLDATNWNYRLECSGAPVVVELNPGDTSLAAAGQALFQLLLDGSSVGIHPTFYSAAGDYSAATTWRPAVAAGSHTFKPQWRVTASTATMDKTQQPSFVVREIVTQNTANNTVTTG